MMQSQIHGELAGGHLGVNGARAWLFVGFVLGFASVIASFWIFFNNFFPKDTSKSNYTIRSNILPYISIRLNDKIV